MIPDNTTRYAVYDPNAPESVTSNQFNQRLKRQAEQYTEAAQIAGNYKKARTHLEDGDLQKVVKPAVYTLASSFELTNSFVLSFPFFVDRLVSKIDEKALGLLEAKIQRINDRLEKMKAENIQVVKELQQELKKCQSAPQLTTNSDEVSVVQTSEVFFLHRGQAWH